MTTTDAAQERPSEGRLGDLWGGLAAMLVAVPSSLAFGVAILSAVSPQLGAAGALAGIVGAAAMGIVAPLVSRNAGFITAPCAPAAAVMTGLAATLAARPGATTESILGIMALTALVSAVLQVIYGTIRVGKLIKYIPYQVVSGYLSGVGLIIALSQLPKALGMKPGTHLMEAVKNPAEWRVPAILVAVVTICVTALAPRVTRRVPAAILGLAAGIGAYFAAALYWPELRQTAGNALLVGELPSTSTLLDAARLRLAGLGRLQWADIALVAGPAATLSVLLSIDTLKTGVVLDALTRRRHDSNRELIGQGVANAASFVAGGVPGAGGMGPTLVNVTSGGRTLLSSVIEGVLVLVALLALGGLVAWVPVSALAGILLVIAWRMFDFEAFKLALHPATRLDFAVIAAVVIVAETIGLIQASVTGICLAILLFIRDQVRGSVVLRRGDLTQVRSKVRRSPQENALLAQHGGDAEVVMLQGNLFFGTTDQLLGELEPDLPKRRWLLLDFRRVLSMDYTGGHLLAQLDTRLRERGGGLLFAGMPSSLPSRQDIEHYLADLGLVRQGGGIRVFDTRDGALEWIEDRVLEAHGIAAEDDGGPLPLADFHLLQGLEPDDLAALESCVKRVSAKAGTRILSAGDEGDEIFFVRSGHVELLLPLPGGKRHHIASIGRGEVFGEMAFLDKQRRSAHADAGTDVELFVLSRAAFDELGVARAHAAVFEQLARELAGRLRVTDAELSALEQR